jgi:hypothetical protein
MDNRPIFFSPPWSLAARQALREMAEIAAYESGGVEGAMGAAGMPPPQQQQQQQLARDGRPMRLEKRFRKKNRQKNVCGQRQKGRGEGGGAVPCTNPTTHAPFLRPTCFSLVREPLCFSFRQRQHTPHCPHFTRPAGFFALSNVTPPPPSLNKGAYTYPPKCFRISLYYMWALHMHWALNIHWHAQTGTGMRACQYL